ncbi:MAG: hypothetical protein GY765_22650 [bacterium]|nr:hypothetical protein [bacterium]
MKKIVFCLVFCVLLFGFTAESFANLNQFAGVWKNANPNSRGITKIFIRVNGADVTLQAWGNCHPKDCDWGTVRALPYAPNAGSNIISEANAITAIFKPRFARKTVVIKRYRGNQLEVNVYTHFKDNSNRTDFWSVEVLKKASVLPLRPAPRIHSKGTMIIRGTWNYDLDKGRETKNDADFWWEQVDRTVRYIVPKNGAKFKVLSRVDFNSISYSDLAKIRYSPRKINGSNTSSNRIPRGTVVAVLTSKGRFCKFRIDNYGYDLKMTWVTYAHTRRLIKR